MLWLLVKWRSTAAFQAAEKGFEEVSGSAERARFGSQGVGFMGDELDQKTKASFQASLHVH